MALLLGLVRAGANLEGGSLVHATSRTLEEFRNAPPAQARKHARVHGYVAEGFHRARRGRPEGGSLHSCGATPPHGGEARPASCWRWIYASLETPDLFKDGAEVVVEGRLEHGRQRRGVPCDEASSPSVPSKFEAQATEAASPVT